MRQTFPFFLPDLNLAYPPPHGAWDSGYDAQWQHTMYGTRPIPAHGYQTRENVAPSTVPPWQSSGTPYRPGFWLPSAGASAVAGSHQGMSDQHLNALDQANAVCSWRQIARHLRNEHLPRRPVAFSDRWAWSNCEEEPWSTASAFVPCWYLGGTEVASTTHVLCAKSWSKSDWEESLMTYSESPASDDDMAQLSR